MPTITVPDDTYSKLTTRAATIGITVEQLVLPVLEQIAPPTPTPEERQRALDTWQRLVQGRANRYPPGFQVETDRETLYREREDAQL